jgi:hypothetical protein
VLTPGGRLRAPTGGEGRSQRGSSGGGRCRAGGKSAMRLQIDGAESGASDERAEGAILFGADGACSTYTDTPFIVRR